jgi:hypothetical protein
MWAGQPGYKQGLPCFRVVERRLEASFTDPAHDPLLATHARRRSAGRGARRLVEPGGGGGVPESIHGHCQSSTPVRPLDHAGDPCEVEHDVVVETGTHLSGSALPWSTYRQPINPGTRSITIATDPRHRNATKSPLARRQADSVLGSSTAPEIVAEVKHRVVDQSCKQLRLTFIDGGDSKRGDSAAAVEGAPAPPSPTTDPAKAVTAGMTTAYDPMSRPLSFERERPTT